MCEWVSPSWENDLFVLLLRLFVVPAILHWMCCPRTTEVTSGDVVTYTCEGGVFDGNAMF